jgi:hypothetical protein
MSPTGPAERTGTTLGDGSMVIIFHTMAHDITICNDVSHKMFEKPQQISKAGVRRRGLLCPFPYD